MTFFFFLGSCAVTKMISSRSIKCFVLFYNRYIFLSSVACEHCPENSTPCRGYPEFQSCRGEFFCRGWRGEKNDTRENASQWLMSPRQAAHVLLSVPWLLPAELVCVAGVGEGWGAWPAPQRHAFHNCTHIWAPARHSLAHIALGEILAGCFLFFTSSSLIFKFC